MKLKPRSGEQGQCPDSPILVDPETYQKLKEAGVPDPNRRGFMGILGRGIGVMATGVYLSGIFKNWLEEEAVALSKLPVYRPKNEKEFPFRIELPVPEWPIHTQEIVNFLGGGVRRDQIVRLVDFVNGQPVWTGRYMVDAFDELASGIRFNPDADVHIGPNGMPIYDHTLIFN